MSRQYHHDVTDGDTILYDVIDEEPEAPYRLCVFMHETFEQKMEIMNNLPDLKCREQDLFLLSYPKTGTNWLWEIMTMITSGSQEVSASDKRYGMIEATPATPDALTDKLPDPRIINSHLLPKYLPKAVLTGKHKCVFIARNPKDAVVSFYNHTKGIKAYEYNGKFENYIQMFRRGEDLSSQAAYDALVDLVPLIEAAKVGSSLFLDCQGSNGHATETPQVTDEPAIVPVDVDYGGYPEYLRQWQRFIEEHPDVPMHVMYYEDLKENFVLEVRKLSAFMGYNLDEARLHQIQDRCEVNNMRQGKLEKTEPEMLQQFPVMQGGFSMIRKGQVGDWKNWFTVAQSEQFDAWWAEETKDITMFSFRYTLDAGCQ